jgi:hypothetical protein
VRPQRARRGPGLRDDVARERVLPPLGELVTRQSRDARHIPAGQPAYEVERLLLPQLVSRDVAEPWEFHRHAALHAQRRWTFNSYGGSARALPPTHLTSRKI